MIAQKFKEKDTEIINNVYGEELQEEELKPVSIKKEDEHKEVYFFFIFKCYMTKNRKFGVKLKKMLKLNNMMIMMMK